MVEINGYDISLTSGDSLSLRVDLGGRDLPEGTDAVFTVKKTVRSRSVVLQKRFNASDEVLDLALTPAETNLAPGMYVWDVRLQIPLESGGYEVYTPMEYAAFAVLETVGDEIGVEGDPGMNPDLPVLQVVLAQARDAVGRMEQAAQQAASAQASAAAAASHAPMIGQNGNWYLYDAQADALVDSGVYSGGRAPYVGENGNWFVGGADTGTPATGWTDDAAKLGGKVPQYYLQPRNLLDNSFFAEPVNQRGQTVYRGAGYAIDRWRAWEDDSIITADNGRLSHTRAIGQYVPGAHRDTVYTLACQDADGNIYVLPAKPSDGVTAWPGMHLDYEADRGVVVRFEYHEKNEHLVWAALYEGEYTAESLPPYVPKGYAAELMECRRYFYRPGYGAMGVGYEKWLLTSIAFPVEMRAVPAVSNVVIESDEDEDISDSFAAAHPEYYVTRGGMNWIGLDSPLLGDQYYTISADFSAEL